EFRTFFSDKVRYLLRNMSLLSASGVLYDIDMRLRPHGTSGSLVTSVNSFQAYHQGKREIWERQMMTRCRPIVDHHDQGQHAMQQIRKQIYRESYDSTLSMEILLMRKRVEDELGSRKGKYDIKRGRGGIMDIDFLTHFLQLKHGYECPDLQIMSTREVLKLLAVHKFVSTEDATQLLIAYDFFKNIEACLRLFDLKSVNSFAKILNDGNALVRAMNYQSTDAATRFIIDYREKSDFVHKMFVDTLNEIDN
ncbi:MAG: glutamate-ammonia-ligase adenylyltransferase, partial [Gammaproteobacteria bacterium]